MIKLLLDVSNHFTSIVNEDVRFDWFRGRRLDGFGEVE